MVDWEERLTSIAVGEDDAYRIRILKAIEQLRAQAEAEGGRLVSAQLVTEGGLLKLRFSVHHTLH